MFIATTKSPGTKSTKRAKITHRTSVAHGLRRTRQTRGFLELVSDAFTGLRTPEEVARIVKAYSCFTGFTIPRWRDLSPLTRFNLISTIATELGVNFALTFDISDEQRALWTKKHGNVTEGFKREVLYRVRHLFREEMTYWLVVEPAKSKGPMARTYIDTPIELRRFDIHMGIRIETDKHGTPNAEQLSRFQWAVWRRTEKLTSPSTAGCAKFPLYKRGRFALMRPLHGPTGWRHYAAKFLRHTPKLHSDVVGSKPFGASHNAIRLSRDTYETIYSLARDNPVDEDFLREVRDAVTVRKAPIVMACRILSGPFIPGTGPARSSKKAPTAPMSPFVSPPRLPATGSWIYPPIVPAPTPGS